MNLRRWGTLASRKKLECMCGLRTGRGGLLLGGKTVLPSCSIPSPIISICLFPKASLKQFQIRPLRMSSAFSFEAVFTWFTTTLFDAGKFDKLPAKPFPQWLLRPRVGSVPLGVTLRNALSGQGLGGIFSGITLGCACVCLIQGLAICSLVPWKTQGIYIPGVQKHMAFPSCVRCKGPGAGLWLV